MAQIEAIRRPVATTKRSALLALIWLLCWATAFAHALPTGFVYVDEAVPKAVVDARYAGSNNFVGAPVDGYRVPRVVLTDAAASALRQVSAALEPFGLGIKVFDGYRPQRAVNHFVRWAADLKDQRTKAQYYPRVAKENLFRDGYIAEKSGHSRGSTVDLTLVNLADGVELGMGTPFDFFGLESWPDYKGIDVSARANRALLQQVMVRFGFRALREEWWHFTLNNEPWPDRYFDFPVE